jgi:hypothetical protein
MQDKIDQESLSRGHDLSGASSLTWVAARWRDLETI